MAVRLAGWLVGCSPPPPLVRPCSDAVCDLERQPHHAPWCSLAGHTPFVPPCHLLPRNAVMRYFRDRCMARLHPGKGGWTEYAHCFDGAKVGGTRIPPCPRNRGLRVWCCLHASLLISVCHAALPQSPRWTLSSPALPHRVPCRNTPTRGAHLAAPLRYGAVRAACVPEGQWAGREAGSALAGAPLPVHCAAQQRTHRSLPAANRSWTLLASLPARAPASLKSGAGTPPGAAPRCRWPPAVDPTASPRSAAASPRAATPEHGGRAKCRLHPCPSITAACAHRPAARGCGGCAALLSPHQCQRARFPHPANPPYARDPPPPPPPPSTPIILHPPADPPTTVLHHCRTGPRWPHLFPRRICRRTASSCLLSCGTLHSHECIFS